MHKSIPAVLAGVMIIGGLLMPGANADHEPAQKVAAAGSDIDQVTEDSAVLRETVRVSSTQDLVLQLTAECSIMTQLTTDTAENSSNAFGSVRFRITIDGTPVLVATDDNNASEDDANDAPDDPAEPGEVTFCNRAYQRTVTDAEGENGAVDTEQDFIRSRTANAFNWLATDIGFNYDDPANGNNIVEIVVLADYDTAASGVGDSAQAYVGSRTLIAEPTNASVHEQVNQTANNGS